MRDAERPTGQVVHRTDDQPGKPNDLGLQGTGSSKLGHVPFQKPIPKPDKLNGLGCLPGEHAYLAEGPPGAPPFTPV